MKKLLGVKPQEGVPADQLHRPTEAMRERATMGLQFSFRYVILLA